MRLGLLIVALAVVDAGPRYAPAPDVVLDTTTGLVWQQPISTGSFTWDTWRLSAQRVSFGEGALGFTFTLTAQFRVRCVRSATNR